MFTVLSIEPVASKAVHGAKTQVVTYLQIKNKCVKINIKGFNLLIVKQNNHTEFIPGMLRQSMKYISSILQKKRISVILNLEDQKKKNHSFVYLLSNIPTRNIILVI